MLYNLISSEGAIKHEIVPMMNPPIGPEMAAPIELKISLASESAFVPGIKKCTFVYIEISEMQPVATEMTSAFNGNSFFNFFNICFVSSRAFFSFEFNL